MRPSASMAGVRPIATPRYSYAVRPSTMYHSSTMYEGQAVTRRPGWFRAARLVYGAVPRRACWAAEGAGSERSGGASVKTEGAPEAAGPREEPAPDEHDDEQWPFFPYSRQYPRPGQMSREEAREQRIAGHVQRHRQRGVQAPRRDRGLSRAEIVSAAIAVADAEGPEAISMRRIAREVGAGAMSLYWHVSSKEELLDLMLDAIEAEIEVPEPTGDWRADLGAFAHRTRAALRQHMWAVEFIGTRPPSGPNDVRNLERLLSLLDGIGVDDYRVIMGIFMTVATFVIGAVIREAQEVRFQAEQER